MSLEDMDVLAHWRSSSRNFLHRTSATPLPPKGLDRTYSGSLLSTVTLISSSFFIARFLPSLKPLMIVCTPTPSSMYGRTSFKISAARRVTEVVPSPTSASWARAMSTSVRAAGWTISRSLSSVAPSSARIKADQVRPPSIPSLLNPTHWKSSPPHAHSRSTCPFPSDPTWSRSSARQRRMPRCC